MAYLADTSILLRLANEEDQRYEAALEAVSTLLENGETVYITPQIMIEFHNGATRPKSVGGLELTPVDALQVATDISAGFLLLPDTPDIYPTWKMLVQTVGVSGKQVHDTRLVAVCRVHGISHLLTFNPKDFVRFQTLGPGLTVVEPASV